jgi:uncharacterized protein YjbI with pentapeptide repeats
LSKPLRSPYPPDLADDAEPGVDWGDLVDAVLENVDAANRRAPRTALLRVAVKGCRLTGADLRESSLTDVTFDDCKLNLTGLRFATIQRVVFRDCLMHEADFYEASLKDVLFERCELREAAFDKARLDRVEIRSSDLSGLRGVEALRGTRMPWVDIIENAALFAAALDIEIVD